MAGYHHRPQKLSDELRLLPCVVAMAGRIADETGYAFLPGAAIESKGTDYAAVAAIIGVSSETERAIMGQMDDLVRQADAWLEL